MFPLWLLGLVGAQDPPTGACCLTSEDACLNDAVAEVCAQQNGFFLGVGTVCPETSCLGTCCRKEGLGCAPQTPEAICLNDGATLTWLPPESDCSDCPFPPTPVPTPAPVGACCTSTNQCFSLTSAECAALENSQSWFVGQECPSACPTYGVCCSPLGSCFVDTQENCLAQQGTFPGGFDCEACPPPPTPVPPTASPPTPAPTVPLGACCLFEGCEQSTETDCYKLPLNGFSWVANALCNEETCPPLTLCCNVCSITYVTACTFPDFPIEGNRCNLQLCADAKPGACCTRQNTCLDVPRAECNSPSEWDGENLCADSQCRVFGACCLNGDCLDDVEEDECGYEGGSFFPGQFSCDPNPCAPPSGVCCTSTDTCTETIETECLGVVDKAVLWIPSFACNESPYPCPNYGSCCVGSECLLEISESECAEREGIFYLAPTCAICPPTPPPTPTAKPTPSPPTPKPPQPTTPQPTTSCPVPPAYEDYAFTLCYVISDCGFSGSAACFAFDPVCVALGCCCIPPITSTPLPPFSSSSSSTSSSSSSSSSSTSSSSSSSSSSSLKDIK